MDYLINMPLNRQSVDEFDSEQALRDFYTQYNCQGVEGILVGNDVSPKIKPDMVQGLHLSFYPTWMPLWENNHDALMTEFGSEDAWTQFYQAKDKEGLIDVYGQQLTKAHELGVKYVVYHVGDTTLDELYHFDALHTDPAKQQRILDDTIDFVNTLYDRYHDVMDYDFLFENLTIGGMDLLDTDFPTTLLDAVKVPNVGIVLDTGHLTNTNLELTTQKEASDYILHVLSNNAEILPYIKGMHINCSVKTRAGYFAEVAKDLPFNKDASYLDQFAQVYDRIGKIDMHLPFEDPAIQQVVDCVQPDFIVNELAHRTHAEWGERIGAQMSALGVLK
ncbi:hypothetical protein AYR62_12310 [Secundilactobacillus paracollinoides]|uniref:Uncharacterized protein n=1 Tax=Secundilactobacillus paracollinoides TaxID=240427 RepID=A0A1B2IWA6_9LACO|nr:TIM barrel protein [Secundilactobacillus paracollinoides]ANZ60471.1 hypothetical protein AYR61_03340 [Secundilactobacillus paracollinoides]ANZ64784.1 hypothetical protein AYR62_12310 [Secundilactobacillus paracollinoides]ANZ66298.1 hypothetical protein AYR63_03535 [Secundilactobacillus paracollinoides]KRL79128.1 hypothetical protein FC17_GL000664 [Secundilactobacillus paracollinoides DSM 15502 = JCM 11969]